MIAAGMSTSCSQMATSTVASGGDLHQVLKDLSSKEFLKSLTISVASAGILHKLSDTFNLPTQPKGWEQHLKVNAVKSMVSSPLHVFIGGEKPQDALLDGIKSCVVNTAGGVMANYLSDLYRKGALPYPLHKGGHFGTAFLLSLGLTEGDIEEAVGAGLAAMMAEVTAESLPSSLSKEARGNVGKEMGAFIGLLAGAKKGTSIFTACNAIDYNFMNQEDDFLTKKKQEEEELENILASLSPVNQAKQGVLQDVLSEDHPQTLGEVKAQKDYQTVMLGWEDQADDFGGSYSTVGDLIEAQQKSENPSLRDLDQRGRARARQFIYPHHRPKSPPRSKKAFFEQSKDYAKETVVRITPEVVKEVGKAVVPYLVKGSEGVMQGLEFVGDHVPGSKVVGQVLKDASIGGLEIFDKALDVMPTAMRRTARTLGIPQSIAQDIGDATHLLQEAVLVFVPAVRALRTERVSTSLVRVESEGIASSWEMMSSESKIKGFYNPHAMKECWRQDILVK